VARMIIPRSLIRSQRNGGGHDHLAVAGAFREGEGAEGVGDAFRRRQAARVFAGKGAGTQPGADDPGIEQVGAHSGLGDLAGIDLDEHLDAGLADRIGASRGRCRARRWSSIVTRAGSSSASRRSGASA